MPRRLRPSARAEGGPAGRAQADSRIEDLHGYDVLTAVEFARTRVQEAWTRGLRQVEFGHGAGDVAGPVESGRGRIKWELRRLLDSGALDAWADRRRSWPKAASLIVVLKPNPRPRPVPWSSPPSRHYGPG